MKKIELISIGRRRQPRFSYSKTAGLTPPSNRLYQYEQKNIMKPFLIKVLLLCLFIAPATAQTSLNFEVVDGKTNKPVSDGISVQKSIEPAKADTPETWQYTIKNTSLGERWIYLNWSIPFATNATINDLHYWSGRSEPVSGDALLKNPSTDATHNTTMLQTVYDKNQGIALALPPDQIVTQFKQTLDSTSPQKYFLHLQIPLVLDAGQSDTFPIEIYHYTPRYGFLDALQKYFSAHPADFTPRKNIDPRAAGVGDGSFARSALKDGIENTYEIGRRFHFDWDWVYAPFKRTGDIYGRQKFWDYTPARPDYAKRRNMGDTAADYHKKRNQEYEDLNQAGIAAASYVPSFLYCEIGLAKELYPDAIIYNPDGSYYKEYTTPWVTGPDNEVEMYPWGNKFAQQSMEDVKQLVTENDVPAFGYDVMAGGVAYRGAGMKESPRRAFDDKGAYVDTSVAIAKMADFTRSLTNKGQEVGLVGNATGGSRPFLVARSDSLMFEQPPYYHATDFIAMRYAAGHKLITIWNPWRLVNLLKWQNMTPEQLRDAYHGAADYMRLTAFRYGCFPSPRWATGVPQIMRMLPLLKEVISEGWQAVPAARGANTDLPDYIWPARYGNDLGSFITIGNASKTPWQGQIAIDNDYLGTSNYLFADVNGNVLSQTVKGRTTLLQISLPAHETLVLRAVASIPASAAGDATVSWNDDGSEGALNIKSTFTPTKVLSPHDGWELTNHEGQSWNFNSLYFASPLQDILNFPFFQKDSTATIIAPGVSDNDAKRLQEYFAFWGKHGITPAREIKMRVYTSSVGSVIGPAIFLHTSKTKLAGSSLYVGNVTQLLNALDQKYFYYGTINGGPSGADILKKADLPGNVLLPNS